jgi:putative transposase
MEVANYQKQYKSDTRLIYSCQYHIIFCPKYRRKVLTDGIDTRAKELILSKQDEYKFTVIEQEVMPDHIHLLLDVSPKVGVYPVVSKIKGFLSSQLRKEFPSLKKRLPCLWTHSNFISTVGSVSLETVKRYIEDQKNI